MAASDRPGRPPALPPPGYGAARPAIGHYAVAPGGQWCLAVSVRVGGGRSGELKAKGGRVEGAVPRGAVHGPARGLSSPQYGRVAVSREGGGVA